MDGGWTVIKKRLRKQDGTVTETGRDGNGSLTVAYVNPWTVDDQRRWPVDGILYKKFIIKYSRHGEENERELKDLL